MYGVNWFDCRVNFDELRNVQFNLSEGCFSQFSKIYGGEENSCEAPTPTQLAILQNFNRLAIKNSEGECPKCRKYLLKISDETKPSDHIANSGLTLISSQANQIKELIDPQLFKQAPKMDDKNGFKLIKNCDSSW